MPTLVVIAGPNGSGKSTFTQSVEFIGRNRLLDPDAIALGLRPSKPHTVAILAAREVLTRTSEYLAARVSFAIETTLSGRGRMELIRKAKSHGYEIHFVYVGLGSAEQCITRIRNRAALGGHPVPDADVRRRYTRSIANIAHAVQVADMAKLYDNSGDGHRLVLVARQGVVVWRAKELPDWIGL